MYYTKLYQWEVVKVSEDPQVLYELELMLLAHAYKTKIESQDKLISEVGEIKRFALSYDSVNKTGKKNSNVHCLLVPSKDAIVVKALLSGEVKEIIDVPKDKYYVFRNDLSAKREKKNWQRYSGTRKHFRTRYYMYMGVLIIVLLAFFKYMPR